MSCLWSNKNMSAYLDGELHDSERSRMEAHLADCPACTRKLDQLRTVQNLFQNPSAYKAPADFRVCVMAQIDEQKSGFRFMQPFFMRFAEVAAILLVISIGLASGGMLTNTMAQKQTEKIIVAGGGSEHLDPLPVDSLASAYLAITEVRQ